MFEAAHDFVIQGGTYTINQIGSTSGIQILHQKAIHGATHDSAERYPPPRCHPETRIAVVREIISWIEDLSRTSSVLWLHGPAGAGKTAIAQTICEYCRKANYLAGSFFFSRTMHGRNTSEYLFATLAYQIAQAIPEVGQIIENTISNDPAIISKAFQVQFQKLIIEPLQTLDLSTRPTVIVIDGLDECDGEVVQCYILQLLGSVFDHGIVPICFIVASRPESWIRDEFNSGYLFWNTRCIGLEQSDETDEDIHTFLRAGFTDIHNSPKYRHTMSSVPKPWPSDEVIADLVERASGQFIYPATVLKFIADPSGRPTDRLNIILSIPTAKSNFKSNPLSDLDKLYTQILSTCADIGITLKVLGAILAMRDAGKNLQLEWAPLSYALQIAEKLLGMHPGDGYLSLRSVHSLVKVEELGESGQHEDELLPTDGLRNYSVHQEDAVKFYHKSFVDFLLDRSRSNDYFIDFESIHRILFLACLSTMRNLSSERKTRINYVIWGYSILHWTEHFTLSGTIQPDGLAALVGFDVYSCYISSIHPIGMQACKDALTRLRSSQDRTEKKRGSLFRRKDDQHETMTTSGHICSPEHHDLEQARIFFDPLGASADFSMIARGKRLRKLADLLSTIKDPSAVRVSNHYMEIAKILEHYGIRGAGDYMADFSHPQAGRKSLVHYITKYFRGKIK